MVLMISDVHRRLNNYAHPWGGSWESVILLVGVCSQGDVGLQGCFLLLPYELGGWVFNCKELCLATWALSPDGANCHKVS